MTDRAEAPEGATPRPWHLDDLAPADPDCGLIKHEGQWIARMSGSMSNPSIAADAALIVAAVNIYDAFRDLEAAAREFEQIDNDCRTLAAEGALTDADDKLYGEARQAVFAALAELDRVRSGQ